MPVTIKFKSGSADVDGFPLPKGQITLAGCTDYFMQSWEGCEVFVDPSDAVQWIKTSSTFHCLLEKEFTTATRVLVLDTTHNIAQTLANYAYRRQTGPSGQHLFVNLDSTGNSGVIGLYPLKSSVPPHHPLDYLPEHKHMFLADSDLQAAKNLKPMLAMADMLTVYVNDHRTDDATVEAIVETLNITQVVVTCDRRWFSLSRTLASCGVSKIPPVIAENRALDSYWVAANNAFYNVFLQQFKTFGYDDIGPLTKFYRANLPTSLRPCGNEESNAYFPFKESDNKTSMIFAAVSGFGEPLMSFWAFVMVDCNGRYHSILPRRIACTLTMVYVCKC